MRMAGYDIFGSQKNVSYSLSAGNIKKNCHSHFISMRYYI
jgi:hypothetical protein